MKKENAIIISIFGVALACFTILSTKIIFHDVPEYITIAKSFAGINNVNLFSTHSLLYPFIISLFLVIWPSIIAVKAVNVLWIFLIGIIILFWMKNKKAFFIFAFSPLIWYVSIQTTPILPASFFIFMAYLLLKKEDIKYNLFYSGAFLGLACAIYDSVIMIAPFFIIAFFWNRKFRTLLGFSIFLTIGIIPRLALDFYLFKMPLYSLIRFFGANAVVSLGLHSTTSNFSLFSNPLILLAPFIIFPFIFRIYKMNFSENLAELFFIVSSSLILLIRTASLKYFFLLSPIIIIVFSGVLTEKEIKWNTILSIILIALLTHGYFAENHDLAVKNDLIKISEKFKNNTIIAGEYEAPLFASFLWQDNPKIYWFEDFQASLKNETYLKIYKFKFSSKIPLRDLLFLSGGFERNDNTTYNNFIIASQDKNLSGFKKEECYEVLCVYR